MNEYQEAIKRVELDFEDRIEEDNILMVGRIDIDALQELVDKETPMKPTLKRGIYDIMCSKCGNHNLNTKWTYGRYCSGCGQAIDRSNEE